MARLSENPEYGYVIGRVRALETDLLNRARYERLVRAPGVREFVAALAETAYSRFLEGGPADVPQALDKAAVENVAFLVQYALDRWLLDLRDAALSDMDKVYLRFAREFEEQYIAQGENENRTIEQTLNLGWKLLAVFPRSGLKRVRDAYLGNYYRQA